jgi:FkbM family methyltransferase
MLSALKDDARCRRWLASLENPTRTRHAFKIFTLQGDLTSDWIKLHGQHEAGTEKFVLEHLRPDTTFLDIGANIGYFSLLAAVVGHARVVAFEPQDPIADLLQKSVDYNLVGGSVRVARLALSDSPASMKMTSCPGNTGHAQLADAGSEGVQPYAVSVVALDDWQRENVLGHVSVCKIDTEGTELRVLQGMAELLGRDGPAIVVEILDDPISGSSGKKILDLLKRRGYEDVSHRYSSGGDGNRYLVRSALSTC